MYGRGIRQLRLKIAKIAIADASTRLGIITSQAHGRSIRPRRFKIVKVLRAAFRPDRGIRPCSFILPHNLSH